MIDGDATSHAQSRNVTRDASRCRSRHRNKTSYRLRTTAARWTRRPSLMLLARTFAPAESGPVERGSSDLSLRREWLFRPSRFGRVSACARRRRAYSRFRQDQSITPAEIRLWGAHAASRSGRVAGVSKKTGIVTLVEWQISPRTPCWIL